MISYDDHFALDVPRNNSHCVPYGRHGVIDYGEGIRIPSLQPEHEDKPWLTSLIFRLLVAPEIGLLFVVPVSISSSSRRAFAQEMGRLGMEGVFSPSALVAFSYAG